MKQIVLAALCLAGCGLEKPILMIDAAHEDALSTDAAPDAYICSDDAYEPNDSTPEATATKVANLTTTQTLSGSICKVSDHDVFLVSIVQANTSLEVLVDRYLDQPDIQASILNAGGTSIANSAPVPGMPNRRRAFAAGLPQGTYFAEVYGPTTSTLAGNNYALTLTVTP